MTRSRRSVFFGISLFALCISPALPMPVRAQASTTRAAPKPTNTDIANLVAAGLSEKVILAAVRDATANDFDLSMNGLLALKKAKVPDAVIAAMQAIKGSESSKPDLASVLGKAPALALPPQNASPSAAAPSQEKRFEFYWRQRKPNDRPPFGDYLILTSDGTFQLVDVRKTQQDKGTYSITGGTISFVASAPTVATFLISNAPGSTRFEPGRIVEPDGTVWAVQAPTPAASQRSAIESPSGAEVLQNACSGIESMGIYRNDAMSAAVGGGIVEWLIKIRNNTAVSKIVVYSWRDMYGQQQRAQVQVRGGDIATQRVDMTQARVIPPVKDARIVSCQ